MSDFIDGFRIYLPLHRDFFKGRLSLGDTPFPYDQLSWKTSFTDIDGAEVYQGDHLIPIRGHYSQKKYKALHVTVEWSRSMFILHWSDGYKNPFPITDLSNCRIVSNRFQEPDFKR